MHKVLSLGALALSVSLLAAMPAHAQEDGNEGAAGVEEAATQPNPNERVCRRVHVTGSNIPQRVCMSRAEWAELREESQETLRRNNQDSGANTSTAGSN